MHKKYGSQGMVAVTVSLDGLIEPNAPELALKILREKKMPFTNLLLDEDDELWQKKLGEAGYPIVFVFNREGKYRKFSANDLDDDGYAKVEKLVAEWVKTK